MDLLSSVKQRALKALAVLRDKAASEGWDPARLEREKDLFMLGHEVTLCSAPGCLEMASPVPGFNELELKCPAHDVDGQGSPGAP